METELSFAEMRVKTEKDLLGRKYLFSDEYWAQKADVDAAVEQVNLIKSEIFGRNQEASLSRLNEKSLAALEEYYQFQTEGPGTTKTVMSFIGLYDGYARKMDRDKLKENVVNALEEQGISEKEFDAIYEYYTFRRDAIRAKEKATETAAKYENGNDLVKFGMNTMTVLNTPVRGLSASAEILASYGYEDPYAPLNVYSPAYDMTNFTDTVRTETLGDIDSETGKLIYQAGMSIADYSTMLPFGATPALALMGTNAGTSSAKNATLQGASKEQALRMASASAAIEIVTEKIPMDDLMKIFKGSGNVPLSVFKHGIIEGTEEFIAEGANAYADNYINGVNSRFSMNVQAYMNLGNTLEDAQNLARQDVLRDMRNAYYSGMISGGFYGTSAHFMGNIVTKSDSVSESVNGYSKDANNVWKYQIEPSKDAWGWQGGDMYAGKDNYETMVLEGSKKPIYLVKLEGTQSGYFTTLETYESLRDADGKVSAVTLSEGLQVGPWKNKSTGNCEYRTQVAIYELESDMEVALGEQTLANYQYGEGTFPQIYIPGYDAKNQANNDAIGLKKIKVEDLKDSIISKTQFDDIQAKNEYQIAKRDMFLMQSAKDNILNLQNVSTDATVQQNCQAYLDILNRDIQEQQALLEGCEADMGELPSQTYDDVNEYLAQKHSGTTPIQTDMEGKIGEVRTDLMRQIQSSIQTDKICIDPNDKIKIVYDANNYCTREQDKIVQMSKKPMESKIDITPKKIDVAMDSYAVEQNDNLQETITTTAKSSEKAVDMDR